MAHVIILECINNLQGRDATGSGTLETLKGLLPDVEAVEAVSPSMRTTEQSDVMAQANVIAGMCENGFTCDSLATETSTLETLIGEL